jgi:hypothetical protein
MAKTFRDFVVELNEALLSEEELAELRASTVQSYARKNFNEKGKKTDHKQDPKAYRKYWKRRVRGLARAAARLSGRAPYHAPLSKEEAEPLVDSLIDQLVEDLEMEFSAEDLAELKKTTLASYRKKAMSTDGAKYPEKQDRHVNAASKHFRKFQQRQRGINRADRLAKEEVDLTEEQFVQLDELRRSTLASYVDKAVSSKGVHAAATGRFAERSRQTKERGQHSVARETNKLADKHHAKSWKREVGIKRAAKRLAREDVRRMAAFVVSEMFEGELGYLAELSYETANNYLAAIREAILAEELITTVIECMNQDLPSHLILPEEDLVELKKATLRSYHQKAVKDTLKRKFGTDKPLHPAHLPSKNGTYSLVGNNNAPKVAQRQKGIKRATQRLAWGPNSEEDKSSKAAGRTPAAKRYHKKLRDYWKEDTDTEDKELGKVESLDELKKSTLASYVKKAADDATTQQSKDINRTDARSTKFAKKMQQRLKGVGRAADKLAKEEVELNELTKATLQSYRDKAKKSMRGPDAPGPKGDRLNTLAKHAGSFDSEDANAVRYRKQRDKAWKTHSRRKTGLKRVAAKLKGKKD